MLEPDFWNNDNSSIVIDELNELKKVVKDVTLLKNQIEGVQSLLDDIENDSDSFLLVEDEYNDIKNKLSDLELVLLLNGEFDKNNCILEIHSGAGGTEACD